MGQKKVPLIGARPNPQRSGLTSPPGRVGSPHWFPISFCGVASCRVRLN